MVAYLKLVMFNLLLVYRFKGYLNLLLIWALLCLCALDGMIEMSEN